MPHGAQSCKDSCFYSYTSLCHCLGPSLRVHKTVLRNLAQMRNTFCRPVWWASVLEALQNIFRFDTTSVKNAVHNLRLCVTRVFRLPCPPPTMSFFLTLSRIADTAIKFSITMEDKNTRPSICHSEYLHVYYTRVLSLNTMY